MKAEGLEVEEEVGRERKEEREEEREEERRGGSVENGAVVKQERGERGERRESREEEEQGKTVRIAIDEDHCYAFKPGRVKVRRKCASSSK